MLQPSETRLKPLNKLQGTALRLYSEGVGYYGVGAALGLSEHSVAAILDSAVNALGARSLNHAVLLQFNT